MQSWSRSVRRWALGERERVFLDFRLSRREALIFGLLAAVCLLLMGIGLMK